jgi:hypothetical protein
VTKVIQMCDVTGHKAEAKGNEEEKVFLPEGPFFT